MSRTIFASIVLIHLVFLGWLSGCGGARRAPVAPEPSSPQSPPEARAPQPFSATIDEEVARLFTHPHPEGDVPWGFEWAPDGSKLVYTRLASQDAGAYLQIRLHEPGSGQEQVIWDRPDRGVSDLAWFPDSQRILIASGAKLFASGPSDLCKFQPVASPQTFAPIHDVQLSPDGTKAAYVSNHDLYLAGLDGGEVRRLTQDGSATRFNGEVDWVYEEELDLSRAFWWSPDGRRIAFLQFDETPVAAYPVRRPGSPRPRIQEQRYPHAGEPNPMVRLGLLELGEGASGPTPIWLASTTPTGGDGETYIARVGWTPSGEQIYLITLDRLQRTLRLILLAPRAGESPRVVIEETDDHWLNLLDEPRFLDGGERFLWRSERDGHAHLYLFDLQGRQERQLTAGDWEVSDVVHVDEDAGQVFFVANRESPPTYQLYSVPLAGGEVRRVSQQPGCHDVTFAPDGRHYVDVHSALGRPPRAELFRADGQALRVLREDDLRTPPDLDTTVAELLTVTGAEGRTYHARMIRPAELEPGRRYPALVWVYGGPGAQMVRDEWRTKYLPWMRLMARRGVLVFSLDGRGSHGRGRDWEKPIYRRLGQIELQDQMEGVEYLRGLEFVDPDRIGIFGWSYGGTMVLHALLRQPGAFRVGVSVAPVTDWRLYDTIYTERFMMRPQDNPVGYGETSLLPLAGQLRDPLLLIHGLSDDNVHFRNSSAMIGALIDAGRRFDVMVYPGQTHGIGAPASRRHVFSTITTHLLEHLVE